MREFKALAALMFTLTICRLAIVRPQSRPSRLFLTGCRVCPTGILKPRSR